MYHPTPLRMWKLGLSFHSKRPACARPCRPSSSVREPFFLCPVRTPRGACGAGGIGHHGGGARCMPVHGGLGLHNAVGSKDRHPPFRGPAREWIPRRVPTVGVGRRSARGFTRLLRFTQHARLVAALDLLARQPLRNLGMGSGAGFFLASARPRHPLPRGARCGRGFILLHRPPPHAHRPLILP